VTALPLLANLPAHAHAHAADMATATEQPAPQATPDEAPEEAAADTRPAARAWLPRFDPGWLLLVPGIVIIGLALVLPAIEDRDRAAFYRDRAQAIEQHGQTRLANHDAYVRALRSGDPATIKALAALQLNQAPAGTELLVPTGDVAGTRASVLERLEPPALVVEEYSREYSTLQRWAMNDRHRLWMLVAGAALVFIGMLPATRRAPAGA
jgi:hypothetical protein